MARRTSEMKNTLLTVITAAAVVTTTMAETTIDLKDAKNRSSYAIGADIAKSLKRVPFELDAKAVAAGLTDGFAGKLALTEAEVQEALTALQRQAASKKDAEDQAASEGNRKAGEAFLAANAKKEGVKTTASGLQYQVLKAGDGKGKSPKATDTVKVHYHGTLIDGTVFDSSVERKEPISFPLNGVIPGWTEGVQLMKEGEKFKFVIPAPLAYGDRGAGPKIGPGATLIFEVELLAIEASN
jgi:FKBP-type peptidyl-prolyl cis-trans isomerase